jgi:hypothetical protein
MARCPLFRVITAKVGDAGLEPAICWSQTSRDGRYANRRFPQESLGLLRFRSLAIARRRIRCGGITRRESWPLFLVIRFQLYRCSASEAFYRPLALKINWLLAVHDVAQNMEVSMLFDENQ